MKALTVNVDTGSGTGFHYWKSWHICPRQRYLDDLRLAIGQKRKTADNYNLVLGSILHAYMRLFFEGKRKFDTETVRFTQSRGRIWKPSESARAAAARLFRAFRANYPIDILGEVTNVEHLYKVTKAPWLPKGMVVTARMDLETKVLKKHAKVIEDTFGLKLQTGEYVVDHKTAGGTRYIPSYFMELQFILYLMIKMLKKPSIKGMLVNVLVKTNPPAFHLVCVRPPGENAVQAMTHWLARAYELSQERPTRCHAHNCYDYGSATACLYDMTHQCPRF